MDILPRNTAATEGINYYDSKKTMEGRFLTCEVPAVPGVAGRHHVLGVEHLLGQLGDC